MRVWTDRSLKSMAGIHPDLRRVLDRALQDSPFEFVVTEGLRSLERQKEMVRIGRSTTMNSRHLKGYAVDLYALVDINRDGRITFEEMSHPRVLKQVADAIKAAAKAENVPVVWGGDWRTFKDYPHIELDRRVYK